MSAGFQRDAVCCSGPGPIYWRYFPFIHTNTLRLTMKTPTMLQCWLVDSLIVIQGVLFCCNSVQTVQRVDKNIQLNYSSISASVMSLCMFLSCVDVTAYPRVGLFRSEKSCIFFSFAESGAFKMSPQKWQVNKAKLNTSPRSGTAHISLSLQRCSYKNSNQRAIWL